MSQSRRHSLFESLTSTAIGFVLAFGILHLNAWLFKWEMSAGEDVIAVAIFTVASIIRQYFVRRLFNRYHLPAGVASD